MSYKVDKSAQEGTAEIISETSETIGNKEKQPLDVSKTDIDSTINALEDKSSTNWWDFLTSSDFWIIVLIIVATIFVTVVIVVMTHEIMHKIKVSQEAIIDKVRNIRTVNGRYLVSVSEDLPEEINAKINDQRTLLETTVEQQKQHPVEQQEQHLVEQQKQHLKECYSNFKTDQNDIQLILEELKELQESYKIFRQSLTEKDEEIKRFKQGYDTALYEKCVKRFIRPYVDIQKEIAQATTEEHKDSCTYLMNSLEIALNENDVTIEKPEIGKKITDYRDVIARITSNTSIPTADQNLHLNIVEVISPAFVLQGQGTKKVLRPAIVKFYASPKQQHSNQQ